jgi:DNA-binding FrmR family transcriptional regulator
MELDEKTADDLQKRLRRVEGQIRGLQEMISDGRDCTDIVTQFAAAIRAVEQAGFKYFATTLAQCAVDPERAAAQGYSPERLEKLFLQLA